ncbi:hypothetical protein IV102_13470 [bacterium]|nr:hypothetical protein [bacterium]
MLNDQTFKSSSLLVGALLFVALLAGGCLALYQAPRLEARFSWDSNNWLVTTAHPPLLVGDRMQSLGGLPATYEMLLSDNAFLASRQQFLSWLDQKEQLYDSLQKQPAAAEVLRGGQRVVLEVNLDRNGWAFLGCPALLHLPVAITFLLVGWATYYRPGAGRQAFWFYLLCLSMSLVYITNTLSLLAQPVFYPPLYRFVNLLNTATFVGAPALLLHFSLLLPQPRAKAWILWIVYGSSAVVIVTLWVPGQAVLVPLFFLTSLLVIVQGAWSYPGAVQRQQMKWVAVGFGLGVGPWLLINGLPLLVWGQRLMTDTLPGACLVFIPISMAVAIHRYRLFDVGTFLEGTFVYLLTLGFLVLCELAIITALGLSVAADLRVITMTALLAAAYGNTRAQLAALLRRLFRRVPLQPQQVLEDLRERVGGQSSPQILFALQVCVEIWLAPQWVRQIPAAGPIGANLDLAGEPCVRLNIGGPLALECGPLPSGRHYTSEVMNLLSSLARQGALYYQNADLYERSLADRQRRLEEREKLLADLHDGVGAALSSIRLLSQEPRVSELAGDALFELQNFLYDGPEYTMEWSLLVAELRAFGQRIFDQGPCQFRLRAEGSDRGLLPRSLALSVFRLYREALSNSLRHSEASQLTVWLRFGANQLEMRVEDNGKGIQAGVRGRGLMGMEKRLAELGGQLRWRDKPGANLEVTIPL